LTTRSRRTAFVVALLAMAAALVAGVAVVRDTDEGGNPGRTAEGCGLPDQSDGPTWPSACWRPYAKTSPFNEKIPYKPKLNGRSDRIIRTITARPPGPLEAGVEQTSEDWGRPMFFSKPGDPVFRVHCTRPWGRCALEGRRIRIPDAAQPAGGGDAHLTVVDTRSGWEYDMWEVARKPKGGGELVTAWGGRTRIDGDGLGSEAVAASFGTLGGLVRPEELEANRIEHALFMTVPCVGVVAGDDTVYPATGQARSCVAGAEAPALGTRIQLMMLPEEIEALPAERWQKTLLHAMAEYGMYVGDTGGGGSWGIQQQSDTTYTSLGAEPRMVAFAKRAGWRAVEDGGIGRTRYLGDFGDVVNWRERLRVVAPCVTAGEC
jgi:hypothetical protein